MKEMTEGIINKLRLFEIFGWLLPGIVVAIQFTCHSGNKLNAGLDWFNLVSTIIISGYGVYCLGYLGDAMCFRKMKEKIKMQDISIQEIVWEYPRLLEIQAEGALFFNMGIAFLVGGIVDKSSIFPWYVRLLGPVSFICYMKWLYKDYPNYLKSLIKNTE